MTNITFYFSFYIYIGLVTTRTTITLSRATMKHTCIILVNSSKNKIKFIDSNLPKSFLSDPNFDLWDHSNNMVISWITKKSFPKRLSITTLFALILPLIYGKISNMLYMKQGDHSLLNYFIPQTMSLDF
jgi:hypothetical protein